MTSSYLLAGLAGLVGIILFWLTGQKEGAPSTFERIVSMFSKAKTSDSLDALARDVETKTNALENKKSRLSKLKKIVARLEQEIAREEEEAI